MCWHLYIVGSTTIMDENQSDLTTNLVLPDIAEHLGTADESSHENGDQVNTIKPKNSFALFGSCAGIYKFALVVQCFHTFLSWFSFFFSNEIYQLHFWIFLFENFNQTKVHTHTLSEYYYHLIQKEKKKQIKKCSWLICVK